MQLPRYMEIHFKQPAYVSNIISGKRSNLLPLHIDHCIVFQFESKIIDNGLLSVKMCGNKEMFFFQEYEMILITKLYK